MKKINDLTIRVEYSVGLVGIEVPDDVFKELNSAFNEGFEFDTMGQKYPLAAEWIRDNIREGDCLEHYSEIIDLY